LVALYMQNRTLAVSRYSTEDPDQDFMYMANAKWFIGGMGGYAQLVAACVARSGGRVFASSFGTDRDGAEKRWDDLMKDSPPE
jgi:hypothetical protein